MEKMVHIWKIRCTACQAEFEHIFRARDILRPHIFMNLDFTCPKCGAMKFDPVSPIGKESLEEWKIKHPDLDIEKLPDYSYLDDQS